MPAALLQGLAPLAALPALAAALSGRARRPRPRPAALRRAGRGFGAALTPPKRQRRRSLARMQPERLRERLRTDHGSLWPAVERVVLGKAATCPEEMVRARFTALRYKDPLFMARTECGDGFFRKEAARLKMWEETLGLVPKTNAMTTPWENVKDVDELEVVKAEGLKVLYKIHCGAAGYLYEEGIFKEHPQLGYVFSISDLQVSQWEDSSARKPTEASLAGDTLALGGT